jgi:hypothetical protein
MSDIIYTPPASSGGGTTINPTNNYIPVRSNATTFIDSCFTIIASNTLQSVFSGTSKGLELDSFQKLYRLGDYALSTNGTMLVVDENNETISTKNINEPKGLLFDYNNAIYKFGDFNNFNNGTSLIIADNNQNIYTLNNGIVRGINFDYLNGIFYYGTGANGLLYIDNTTQDVLLQSNGVQFAYGDGVNNVGYFGVTGSRVSYDGNNQLTLLGDTGGNFNATYLQIDDANSSISTYLSGQRGILLDYFNKNYWFGDWSSGNGTYFLVQESTNLISTGDSLDGQGILLNFNNYEYFFGDFNGVNNSTYIYIKDQTSDILLTTNGGTITSNCNSLSFNGSLTQTTSGGNSGQHLQVNINGTNYVITLLNP